MFGFGKKAKKSKISAKDRKKAEKMADEIVSFLIPKKTPKSKQLKRGYKHNRKSHY